MRADACTDVVVFALVGSGQKPATDLSGSPQLRVIYDAAVAAAAPAHRLALHVIDYPAKSVNVLFAGITVLDVEPRLRDNMRGYLAGEKQGVAALRRDLAARLAACPQAKVALIGYSQGAMVVHEVLNELADGDTASRAAVVGAVLLADPERAARASPVELGTAGADSHGACESIHRWVSCAAPDPLADVRAPFDRLTASVCDRGDAVCDTSELIGSILHHPTIGHAKEEIRAGMAAHRNYASVPETAAAGAWLGKRIAAGPD
jgi:predicted esterase